MTPSLPSDQNIFFFSFGHRHGRGINVYFIRFCLVVVAHSGEKSPNDVGPSEEVDLQPYHHKMFFYREAAVQVKFFHHLRQAQDCSDNPLWVRSLRCACNAAPRPPMGSRGPPGPAPTIDPFPLESMHFEA